MNDPASHPVINDISNKLDSLTPKAQALGTYIIQNPSKAVFMTTKELAETCDTSEATVVRFVSTIGYKGYSDFQEALKDFVNTGLSLPDHGTNRILTANCHRLQKKFDVFTRVTKSLLTVEQRS